MPLPTCTTSNEQIMSNKQKKKNKKRTHTSICVFPLIPCALRARISYRNLKPTSYTNFQLTNSHIDHHHSTFDCVAAYITAYTSFSARTNYLMNELQTTDRTRNWIEPTDWRNTNIDANGSHVRLIGPHTTLRARSTTLVFLRKSMCSHTHTRFCVCRTFLLIQKKTFSLVSKLFFYIIIELYFVDGFKFNYYHHFSSWKTKTK